MTGKLLVEGIVRTQVNLKKNIPTSPLCRFIHLARSWTLANLVTRTLCQQ